MKLFPDPSSAKKFFRLGSRRKAEPEEQEGLFALPHRKRKSKEPTQQKKTPVRKQMTQQERMEWRQKVEKKVEEFHRRWSSRTVVEICCVVAVWLAALLFIIARFSPTWSRQERTTAYVVSFAALMAVLAIGILYSRKFSKP